MNIPKSDEIKVLLSKGEIEPALELLLEQSENDSQLHKEATVLSGRFQRWKKEKNLIGTQDDAEVNRIQVAILDLLDAKQSLGKEVGFDFGQLLKLPYLIGLALIVGIGVIVFNRPNEQEPQTFGLTLQFHGPGGTHDIEDYGTVKVLAGDAQLRGEQRIPKNGELILNDIAKQFETDTIFIEFVDLAYKVAKQTPMTAAEGKRITFVVVPIGTSISGTVFFPDGRTPVPGARIFFQNSSEEIVSDNDGNFETMIPMAEGTRLSFEIRLGGKVVYSNTLILADGEKYPFTIDKE